MAPMLLNEKMVTYWLSPVAPLWKSQEPNKSHRKQHPPTVIKKIVRLGTPRLTKLVAGIMGLHQFFQGISKGPPLS